MKTLKVEIVSIVFSSEDNGYVVARTKAEDEPGLVTIVGYLGNVAPGESLILQGDWKEHPKFGRQFMVESFEQVMPATKSGILKYLASGQIRGVGPVMAQRLLDHLGPDILTIMDEEPQRLREVEGIGPKKYEQIMSSWRDQRDIRGLMLFLQSHDVAPTYAVRIYRRYGSDAVARLKENPYDLAYEIQGIGFKTADAMALKLGFEPDSPERLEALLLYVLKKQSEKGHVYFPRERLLQTAAMMVEDADRDLLENALSALETQKRVALEWLEEEGGMEVVYLRAFLRMEREVASRLYALMSHPFDGKKTDVAGLLKKEEKKQALTLSEEQREAVMNACHEKGYIITGGPGTGKTTITRMMVRVFRSLGLKTRLAAPTGRAAKRLSEATGVRASTLHRMLGYSPDGRFAYNEEKKIKADVLILDEVSMLDIVLFFHLLRAVPLTCRLIMVGDVNQLPSVGPGNVLRDLLSSEQIPGSVLNTIYRQAQQSGIVVNAHRINVGKFPVGSVKDAPQADFFWVEQDEPERVNTLIRQLVCERIPQVYGLDPLHDIQVLTPMHKGDVGTESLNRVLQDDINPRGEEIKKGFRSFRVGDRVLQVRNNYEKDVFNGDLGWIHGVDRESGALLVQYEERLVQYGVDELDELILAYAISVHKSQGSEYPAVIVPVVTQHYVLLQRNLFYTALTRARSLAVMIGSKRAMSIALRNIDSGKRFTRLEERVRRMFSGDDQSMSLVGHNRSQAGN